MSGRMRYYRDRIRIALVMREIRRDCRNGEHVWRGSDDGAIRCKFCGVQIGRSFTIRGES